MAHKRTGLVGYPVSHSLSPIIHQHWIDTHSVDASYELFAAPPESLGAAVTRLREQEVCGFNVTIPHKETIVTHIDSMDKVARRIGAVNTVMRVGELLLGTNTDAYGFITHLKQTLGDIQPHLENVVILGAGGAARAAVAALKEAGAQTITLANRSQDKAKKLAEEFQVAHVAWDVRHQELAHTTLLVNTTSLGMKGSWPLELSLEALPTAAAVYDIVYTPLETELLKTARAHGAKTVDGLGMLLHQAAAAFRLWHGVEVAVTDALRQKILGKAA